MRFIELACGGHVLSGNIAIFLIFFGNTLQLCFTLPETSFELCCAGCFLVQFYA